IAAAAYLTAPFGSSRPEEPVGLGGDGKIHVPLFVKPELVRPTPRFRFTFDPPEVLADLRSEEKLDVVIEGASDDMDKCTRLMHWARRQWEPGVPSPYPPINARVILHDIRRGFTGGFCAQYNYVLVQAMQSFGIPARYVSLIGHEVIEARLPDAGRWVCLDPLYDTYYEDEDGRALSVLEIHALIRNGRPVRLSDEHLVGDVESHMQSFRSFAVWLKNDHVSSPLNFSDLEKYKVYFLDESTQSRALPPGTLTTSEPLDLYPG
ncbi:MAG: transglutaminase domain-containing protein, partial [Acidobacteriota bacterium]